VEVWKKLRKTKTKQARKGVNKTMLKLGTIFLFFLSSSVRTIQSKENYIFQLFWVDMANTLRLSTWAKNGH